MGITYRDNGKYNGNYYDLTLASCLPGFWGLGVKDYITGYIGVI